MIPRVGLVLMVLLAAAPKAAAQLPGLLHHPWGDRFYPKVFWTAREGLTGGVFVGAALQPEFAFDTPAPHRVAIALDGQISTSGSRFARLDAAAPALANGWRFSLTLSAERWRREPYYGIGNGSASDGDTLPGVERYYRALHRRTYARGAIQRRIVGGLRVLVGWHAERWLLDSLASPSQIAVDAAQGADPRLGVPTDDLALRFGLVFDTRDREAAPQRGVLLEALHARADESLGGDLTYTRTTVSARGWLPVSERWGLAARVAGETMGGTPAVGAFFTLEGSERPIDALGGSDSHRALPRHRFLDADKLVGNFEARYAVLPHIVRAVLMGFVDVGRVFPAGELALTTEGLKIGGGLGAFVHFFSETAVLGTTLGVGPEGLALQGHWRWTF